MNGFIKGILLLLPYIFMVLGFDIYNRVNPQLGGLPFFYWYQLVWIFIAAILTFTVYLVESKEYERKKVNS
jgi:pilus assembly protein TadC